MAYTIDITTILLKLWDFLKKHVNTPWKGFWIGFLLCLFMTLTFYLYFLHKIINEHFDLGERVGSYSVLKGEHVDVVANELTIIFSQHVFEDNGAMFVFPSFEFNSPTIGAAYYYKLECNQPVYVESKYYYFTFLLREIEIVDIDTTAYFDVFKKVLPKKTK